MNSHNKNFSKKKINILKSTSRACAERSRSRKGLGWDKTRLTLVIALLITIMSFAQQGINYKALIKDTSGNALVSTAVNVQFTIQQGASLTDVYEEGHTALTDDAGIIIVNIGQGTTSLGDFDTIDWGSDDHFLNVQINTGSGFIDMGTTQFMAVPYALHAKTAEGGVKELNDLEDAISNSDGTSLFIGEEAGFNDDGTNNQSVGIGIRTLYSNTTGEFNTASGAYALRSNTIGLGNTANGYGALFSNITGIYNTAIGNYALYFNNSGEENTAVGRRALFNNTIGFGNTAIGFHSLYNNTSAVNTAIGMNSLYSNTSGDALTAIGYKSMESNTTGFESTAIGYFALSSITTGRNNIGIGYNVQASSPTVSHEVTIGNSNNNAYRMFAASWTNASDKNLKHNIENIPVGLDFVLKLHPVQFVYNNANKEQKTLGFIAQEVKKEIKNAGLDENTLVSPLNKDYLGLRTTELIAVLTKAIQEQQQIIDMQSIKVKKLEDYLTNRTTADKILIERVNAIEKIIKKESLTKLVSNHKK